LRSVQSPRFRPECRWVAVNTGLSVDTVNIAIHRLLRAGELAMEFSRWKTTRAHYA
jgi:hypothetical protein